MLIKKKVKKKREKRTKNRMGQMENIQQVERFECNPTDNCKINVQLQHVNTRTKYC